MILARILDYPEDHYREGLQIHIGFNLTKEDLIKELQTDQTGISEATSWYMTGT